MGVVTDAAGAPAAGSRVLLDAVSPTMSFDPPLTDHSLTITDAEGEFSARVHEEEGHLGELALRAGVIKAGTTDTLRFRLGMARFRTGSALDTIRVAITVP